MWPGIRNVLLAILLAAAAAEAALRIAAFLPLGHPAYVNDSEIGIRLRPGEANSDRLGFRGGDAALAAGAEIAFVGDSFMYGMPDSGPAVADLTGSLLKRMTANLGVPGSGPPEYELVARAYAGGPSIRLIVVGIYVGNDVHQSPPGHATLSYAGDLRTLPTPGRFDLPLGQWYLPRVVSNLVRAGSPRCAAAPPHLARLAGAESRLYRGETAREFDASYVELGAILARMRARARARDAELLAVVQPTRFQAEPAYAAAIAACLGETPGAFDPAAPSRRLMSELAARNVPALDLTPAFAETREGGLYIEGDSHWTGAGNRLAAEIVAREIRSRFGL